MPWNRRRISDAAAIAPVTMHLPLLTDPRSQLPDLAARHQYGELGDAEYATLYVMTWQVARFGSAIAQRRSRHDAPPDGVQWLSTALRCAAPERIRFLADCLNRYDLRGVRRRVGETLGRWLCGEWRPVLRGDVPQPRDVLRMQACGTRPVTVIAHYPRLLQPVLDKPDAFAFVCHDLEHAWQFFHAPKSCRTQQRLARRLERAWAAGVFDACLADPVFAEKFEYLAADMNTHVLHSLQYLRAILIEHHLRQDGLNAGAPLSSPARAAINAMLAAALGEAGRFFAGVHGGYTALDVAALEATL